MKKRRPHAFIVVLQACLLAGLLLQCGCVVPGYAPLLKEPALSSDIRKGTLQVAAMERSFLFHVPDGLPDQAPLVMVLHGSLQTAGMMRVSTGYEFERLADQRGFVVVYPNGYRKHWNDCRRQASYAARTRNMDDTAFMLALIDHFQQAWRIDAGRVFAVGYSNGGQFVYRLALEAPEHIAAAAVIAANLPTEDNCDCRKTSRPVPILILNGTKDPINPYAGGSVRILGFGNRGPVLSARASADYFAGVNGHVEAPGVRRVANESARSADSVEVLEWRKPGKADVVLVTIDGGGHTVPQPVYRAPFWMGRTSDVVNGPEVIWDFFARQRMPARAEEGF